MLGRVSTYSLQFGLRDSIRELQVDLEKAQQESISGRHADTGLVLGTRVSYNLDWRIELNGLNTTVDRNNRAKEKAAATQSAMDFIRNAASELMEMLPAARTSQNGKEVARNGSQLSLGAIADGLRTSFAGTYLFSGISADVDPLVDYQGSPAETAFDAAFQAEFGFAKTDAQAANISASQITQFLNGTFSDIFDDPNWQANWSSVSSVNPQTQIDKHTKVDASANIGERPFRDVLWAAIAVFELSNTAIGQGAFQAIADAALTKLANSAQGLGEIQARIGQAQKSMEIANNKMESRSSLLESAIARTEGVDPYDAVTRLNSLSNQLEASYSVTSRISKLSLMNYI
jgi:flagellar hook-associated protein 3 FlgL